MQALRQISLSGFRSIRDMGAGLDLRPVNVLIGANGTGKSNLVGFFRLLNHLTTESLGRWTEEHGGASAQLYYGQRAMEASLTYSDGERTNTYGLSLLRVAPDNLRFAEETLRYHQAGRAEPVLVLPGGGGEESRLMALARSSESSPEANTARVLRSLLGRTSVYHFHDTSDEARVKRTWRLADNRHLKWDGGNLAPVLHRLREEHRAHYDRIEGVIRQVVPFFGNFVLEPTAARPDHHILLEWRERGSDLHFGAYQLSDGTLRFMLLATLLGMPEERFARVVIIDEPELGLHPAALEALGNMVYSASSWTQVILTTQSAALLDVFDPEDVVVVSRVREEAGRYETQFRRLAGADLAAWEEFSLGELWDKNVLGGRPMA